MSDAGLNESAAKLRSRIKHFDFAQGRLARMRVAHARRPPLGYLRYVRYRTQRRVCGMVPGPWPSPFYKNASVCFLIKAVTVDDPEEFNLVFSELRNALRGQLAHLKEMVDEAKQTIPSFLGNRGWKTQG